MGNTGFAVADTVDRPLALRSIKGDMDVLHVIHQFAPESRGGSESYALDLARRQRTRGFSVAVLTGTKHWAEEVRLVEDEFEGLPVYRLNRNDLYFDHHVKMWHPEVEERFERFLRQHRPALVHIHHWVRLTCNLVEICERVGVPNVVTLHDYYTSCPRAFRRRVGDEACRRSLSSESCRSCVPKYGHEPQHELDEGIDLYRDSYRSEVSLARVVLVAVDSTADLLSQTTGIDRSRYRTLPLGYRQRFDGLPKLKDPTAGAPLRFAYWGGVGRHKGVDALVSAFRQVEAARPGRAELHVLGDFESPQFGDEMHTIAAGLPVNFHGVFDPEQLHAVAPDVGVFPSTCIETFGIVLDECFELGRPCITSDLGALPDRSGGAGMSTRAGDSADIARAMLRLLDEPRLWGELVSKIPPPPPALDQHAADIEKIYEDARTAPVDRPQFATIPLARRQAFWRLQMEAEASGTLPPGGPR